MDNGSTIDIGHTQQNLLKIIRKGHIIIHRQLFFSFYSVFLYIFVFLLLLLISSEEVLPIEIILLILNSVIFFFVALNNIVSVLPIWRILDQKFKSIEKMITEEHLIQKGLSSYINTLLSLLQTSKDVTIKFDRNWIVHLFIGLIIVIINAFAIILIDPLSHQQNSSIFWLGIVYLGVFISYLGILFTQRKSNLIFHSWKKISLDIIEWENKIEKSFPLVVKDDKED
jgi:hypothetical protein